MRPILGIASCPVTERAELEHLTEHAGEDADEHEEHQKDDCDATTDGKDAKDAIRAVAVVVSIVTVAAHHHTDDKAEDERQNPADNRRDETDEDLRQNSCTEQLSKLFLAALPNLAERKRALDAASHREVHDGGVADHVKNDGKDDGSDKSNDDQQDQNAGKGVARAAVTIGVAADCAQSQRTCANGRDDDENDKGHPRNDGENAHEGILEDTQRKHRRAQKGLFDIEALAAREVASPLDGVARTAERGDRRDDQSDGACKPTDDRNNQNENGNQRDGRRQERNLAHATENALNLGHILESLREATLGIHRSVKRRLLHGRHLLRGLRPRLGRHLLRGLSLLCGLRLLSRRHLLGWLSLRSRSGLRLGRRCARLGGRFVRDYGCTAFGAELGIVFQPRPALSTKHSPFSFHPVQDLIRSCTKLASLCMLMLRNNSTTARKVLINRCPRSPQRYRV